MRRLVVTRQRLVLLLIAIECVDALFLGGIGWAIDGTGSFSRLARDIFLMPTTVERALETLDAPRAGPLVALAGWLVAAAFLEAYVRASFLLGLIGESTPLRPPRHIVLRLALYGVLVNVVRVVQIALAENGLVAVALVLDPLIAAATLYADYAIVIDDVGLPAAVRRSVEAVRATLAYSAGLWLTWLLVLALVDGTFDGGFEDKRYVQPTYLGAYLLVRALVQFLADVSLITVYRSAPLRPRPDPAPD
jgi:hypothetical protein